MSTEILYWVTRGHKLIVPSDSKVSVDQYIEAIEQNGVYENNFELSLETVEKTSECVHFDSDIVTVDNK